MKVELSPKERQMLADALWRIECDEDGSGDDFDCPFWSDSEVEGGERCGDQCTIIFKKLTGKKWDTKRLFNWDGTVRKNELDD